MSLKRYFLKCIIQEINVLQLHYHYLKETNKRHSLYIHQESIPNLGFHCHYLITVNKNNVSKMHSLKNNLTCNFTIIIL